MKQALLSILLSLLSQSVFAQLTGSQHLSVEVLPPINVQSGALWNLSTILVDEAEGVTYRSYEGSLLSEECNGIRSWYSTDTCGFIRIESRLWRLDPLIPVKSGIHPDGFADYRCDFVGDVERESMPSDTLLCRLELASTQPGLLVLPGPDTINACMTRELLGISDSSGEYIQETLRWFEKSPTERGSLPLATVIKRSYAGNLFYDRAFVLPGTELPETEETIIVDLSSLEVRCDGGRVTLTAPCPTSEAVHLDVTDMAGRSYAYAILEPGQTMASADISSLPPGTYLAVITCRGQVRKVPLVR